MSRRADLMAAVNASDWATIEQLGWKEIFATLKRVWPKKLTATDALAYAQILGNHPPERVLEALVDTAANGEAKWRPGAAQVAAAIAERYPAAAAAATQHIRPDQHPITLRYVAELHERGAAVCECRPRHTFRLESGGVLRCLTCNGLEQGQVDDALDDIQEAA